MRHWKAALLITTGMLILPAPASAGLMDQLGGLLGGAGDSTAGNTADSLSNSEIIAGLKDALSVSSEKVVAQLGKTNGFNDDPKIHIPLPASMERVKSALDSVGMGSMMDDLELRMNRAAEAATPKAKKLFIDAIRQMSIGDARNILDGPDDAATQYFKSKMSKPLSEEMRPIVKNALAQTGAVKAYDNVMGKYESLPFMPDVKANLTRHVLDGGLAGIFYYMAREEAAIRHDPIQRTTEILKKVFGRQGQIAGLNPGKKKVPGTFYPRSQNRVLKKKTHRVRFE